MIPVTQTKVVVKNSKGEEVVSGNCFAAVIASLLELPIEEVPNVEIFFDLSDTYWIEVMDKFLKFKGYELMSNDWFKVFHDDKYGFENKSIEDAADFRQECTTLCKDKYYLVSGKSVRGVYHICIYMNGKLVHDPHPTREGLVEEKYFQSFDKVNPPCNNLI